MIVLCHTVLMFYFLNKAILLQSFLVLEIKFASTSATIIVIMLFLICANRNTQLQMLYGMASQDGFNTDIQFIKRL